jgi:hypothetical protein
MGNFRLVELRVLASFQDIELEEWKEVGSEKAKFGLAE